MAVFISVNGNLETRSSSRTTSVFEGAAGFAPVFEPLVESLQLGGKRLQGSRDTDTTSPVCFLVSAYEIMHVLEHDAVVSIDFDQPGEISGVVLQRLCQPGASTR